jgi:inner membrane protein
MDPLTQGVLGAALSQSVVKKEDLRTAFWLGAVAGMAPDLDVLISSKTDHLLFLEFHRQFTHSLIFIPVGGALVAWIYWLLTRRRHNFVKLFWIATLGWGTHGLLDACTSYGTLLYWPFTNFRVAWNNVGIIDPVPTLSLLALTVMAAIKFKPWMARVGLGFFLMYLGWGVIQRDRATFFAQELIKYRGHSAERLTVKPTIANLVLWRSIYRNQERYYVDAIRVPVFGAPQVFEGSSIQELKVERDFPGLANNSTAFKDIERFAWFSDNYVAPLPDRPSVIGDIRYATLPNDIRPLWGIEVDTTKPNAHTPYVTFRNVDGGTFKTFWRMIWGD